MIKIEGKMEDDIPTEPSELRSTILGSSGNIFWYLQTSSLIMGEKHWNYFDIWEETHCENSFTC